MCVVAYHTYSRQIVFVVTLVVCSIFYWHHPVNQCGLTFITISTRRQPCGCMSVRSFPTGIHLFPTLHPFYPYLSPLSFLPTPTHLLPIPIHPLPLPLPSPVLSLAQLLPTSFPIPIPPYPYPLHLITYMIKNVWLTQSSPWAETIRLLASKFFL